MRMQMRTWLSLLMLSFLAVVWVYDLAMVIRQEPASTVSATMLEWSQVWPILPFLMGVVIGHLLWPQR